MNLRSTRAIVARTMRMSDSSKLVTLITESHGLVKVVAKGARRPKSVFGASLEPVTLIRCIYHHRDQRDLQSLSSAEILNPYERLKDDLASFAVGSAIVEVAQTHTSLEDTQSGAFAAVVAALDELEAAHPHDSADAEKHLWRFALRFLGTMGYHPSLDACVICGAKPRTPRVFFSFGDGGLVCSCTETRERFGLTVSPGALLAMKRLMAEPASGLPRLRIPEAQLREIERIVVQFLAYHVGSSRPLRSLAFLHELTGEARRRGHRTVHRCEPVAVIQEAPKVSEAPEHDAP